MSIYRRLFFPDEYLDSIFAVEYDALYRNGIRGLIYDIDNTLAEVDRPEPTERVIKLLNDLKAAGFSISLLSNNNERRVRRFNEKLGLNAIHKAGKPSSAGIARAMRLMGTVERETALIGDQVFTDVWCARRLGIYAILVRPISKKDDFTVALKRWPERLVLKRYMRETAGERADDAAD